MGNVSVRKLRAQFGMLHNKAGLIYASGQWLPPSKVFLGAPIFGSRRPFVSEKTAAERLWRVLRIRPPSIADCIAVLNDLARDAAGDQEEQSWLIHTTTWNRPSEPQEPRTLLKSEIYHSGVETSG